MEVQCPPVTGAVVSCHNCYAFSAVTAPCCSAFRNAQGSNACLLPKNSCLLNQLKDLYVADMARMNRGEAAVDFAPEAGMHGSRGIMLHSAAFRVVGLMRCAAPCRCSMHRGDTPVPDWPIWRWHAERRAGKHGWVGTVGCAWCLPLDGCAAAVICIRIQCGPAGYASVKQLASPSAATLHHSSMATATSPLPRNPQASMDPSNRQLSLNLPVPGMRTSIVSLSVAADDVKFVVNNSPANITRAQVCEFLYAHSIPACLPCWADGCMGHHAERGLLCELLCLACSARLRCPAWSHVLHQGGMPGPTRLVYPPAALLWWPCQVCTYDRRICGGFESMTTQGYLYGEPALRVLPQAPVCTIYRSHLPVSLYPLSPRSVASDPHSPAVQLLPVDVRNTGYLAATYIVSVTECSSGVLPIVVRGCLPTSLPQGGRGDTCAQLNAACWDLSYKHNNC